MTSPARATARSSPGAEAPWVGSPGAGSPEPAVTPGSQKVGGREHLHRVRQALHQVPPERCQRLFGAGGEVGRGQHAHAEAAGQALDAAGQVDGRADHREVEALEAADVAVADFAEMQGDPEVDGRLVLPQAALVEHRSEEHTSELQSLMRISYAVFCLKKKNMTKTIATRQ